MRNPKRSSRKIKYMVKKGLEVGKMYGSIECAGKHKVYEGHVIKTYGKLVNDKIILVYDGVDFNRNMLMEMKK